jgi:hypothetical protein
VDSGSYQVGAGAGAAPAQSCPAALTAAGDGSRRRPVAADRGDGLSGKAQPLALLGDLETENWPAVDMDVVRLLRT